MRNDTVTRTVHVFKNIDFTAHQFSIVFAHLTYFISIIKQLS